MSCNYSSKINDYLDGESSRNEVSDLSSHLEGCSECSAVLFTEKEQRALLRSLSSASLSESRFEGVWDRIESKTSRSNMESASIYNLVFATSCAFLLFIGVAVGFMATVMYRISSEKSFKTPEYSSGYVSGDFVKASDSIFSSGPTKAGHVDSINEIKITLDSMKKDVNRIQTLPKQIVVVIDEAKLKKGKINKKDLEKLIKEAINESEK